ncbi:MAG TPA: hypothetical protein VNI02_11265 [Blastocatellia bacterium]|jgi:hypothetical protein|nr:hypothetical protein [Blastocatellia bacterium]
MDATFGIFILLFTVLGVGTAAAWAHFRWSKLKPLLFPLTDETDQYGGEFAAEVNSRGQPLWLKNVPQLLSGVHRMLEKEEGPEVQAVLEASRKLQTDAPELAVAIQSVIVKAVESGELKSLLVGKQDLYAYIVVIPNRHEHPHLIRRYAPFSAGWAGHADLVRASLISSNAFSAMLGYLFFLSPDAKEGILLMSYADPNIMLVPSSLLQGSQLKGVTCKAMDAAMEFNMSD